MANGTKLIDDVKLIADFSSTLSDTDSRIDVLEKYGMYTSLSDLRKAAAGNFPYILITPIGNISYAYTPGDFTGRIDDTNIVALNGTPITIGALVCSQATTVGFNPLVIPNPGTVSDRMRRFIVVTDASWGAKGDGTSDDYTAIQSALDYAEQQGGGDVVLPLTLNSQYRITRGLKIGSYTRLRGLGPCRYPFNAGNRSALVADFSEFRQWIIEPKTLHQGNSFAYNEMIADKVGVGGGLPSTPTFNCSIANLVITSKNTLPYGGIRLHGCPGSVINNVSVHNVGCGVLINCCFGGRYSVHTLSAYYGVVAFDDVNGNSFEIYAARMESYSGVVPDAYQTAAYKNIYNKFISVHGLAKNDHFNRSTGLIFMSGGTTNNTNVVEYVGERFTNALFVLYTYSLLFTKFYVESDQDVMLTAIAGARSDIKIDTFHAYMSGGGEYFDTGFVQKMDISVNGIAFARSWGSIQAENATYVKIRNRSIDEFGPTTPQYNLIYDKAGAWKSPTFTNGATSAPDPDTPAAYRKQDTKVYLKGSVVATAANVPAFTLPQGYRPPQRITMSNLVVTASGDVIPLSTGTIILNCIFWDIS